ncbi:unnamed protein product [Mesocestoides corti]|uniref:Uncharacterized protein n=1 Tax=Mesocestoides corti TaxID=53468 RepID=A0A0R3U3D4_MESCO|nr:unnamed protein product [Mesocestoides corti]
MCLSRNYRAECPSGIDSPGPSSQFAQTPKTYGKQPSHYPTPSIQSSRPPSIPSTTSFQEALQMLYQKHPLPSRPLLSNPFPMLPTHMLRGGPRKRFSTDDVEGPSRGTIAGGQSFPRRQSESGLYRLAERMQRQPPGGQGSLKRVRSEQQDVPFSMLGQHHSTTASSGQPFALTMVLGEQAPVTNPEQLARNIFIPLLNPSQAFQTTTATAPSSSPSHHHHPRTPALDLLLMTEGEARQLSETMLAGSSGVSHTPSERLSNLPAGLSSALRSYPSAPSTSDETCTPQVIPFTGAPVDVTPTTQSRTGPISADTNFPSASELQTSFRRSEAAKCRRVYGAVNKSRWCKQCRWKKACTRFQGPPHKNDPSNQT